MALGFGHHQDAVGNIRMMLGQAQQHHSAPPHGAPSGPQVTDRGPWARDCG